MARPATCVVVMAGGHGTRFWPRSRERLPKQLLAIAGRRSLLQETLRRARRLCSLERTFVVTAAGQQAAVRRQLPALPRANLLVEPVGRNTGPCIALAAEVIRQRHGDATMVVLPADHAIADERRFLQALRRAIRLASERRCLIALGIRPRTAETGYGYIEVGAPMPGPGPRAFWARAFHEKPDRRTAEQYLASGRYLWNSGMFVWRTEVIREALAQYLPAVAAAMAPVGVARTRSERERAIRRAYRGLQSISIDKGVMERAPLVAVVEADFGWSDVGSWAAMPELWGMDGNGNSLRGRGVFVDATGSIVFSPSRVAVLLGVRDLVVVDSEDALLVCHRDRAQEVRQVVEALRRGGFHRLL